jgi:glycosyltransferase involved in cell wall biosynthesis
MGVGGITDVVEDGVSGLLVQNDEDLADALVRVLTDRTLADRLAAGASEAGARWVTTPDEFADRLAELVEATAYTPAR